MILRSIFYHLLCLTLLMQTSCVTKHIWKNSSYDEKIEKFLIDTNGVPVTFIGNNGYYYKLSDRTGILRTFLLLKQKNILTLEKDKNYLKLFPNNDVSGKLIIKGPFNILPPIDIDSLHRVGLRGNSRDAIRIEIDLIGRRYPLQYLGDAKYHASSLYRGYNVPVYFNDHTVLGDSARVLLTPFTIALDVVGLLGKGIFMLFTHKQKN